MGAMGVGYWRDGHSCLTPLTTLCHPGKGLHLAMDAGAMTENGGQQMFYDFVACQHSPSGVEKSASLSWAAAGSRCVQEIGGGGWGRHSI